jgi:hypothetical protein
MNSILEAIPNLKFSYQYQTLTIKKTLQSYVARFFKFN